jgi:hypothetical protein
VVAGYQVVSAEGSANYTATDGDVKGCALVVTLNGAAPPVLPEG